MTLGPGITVWYRQEKKAPFDWANERLLVRAALNSLHSIKGFCWKATNLGKLSFPIAGETTVFTSDYLKSQTKLCNKWLQCMCNYIFLYLSFISILCLRTASWRKPVSAEYGLVLVRSCFVNSGIYFCPISFLGLDLSFGVWWGVQLILTFPRCTYHCIHIPVSAGPCWCLRTLPFLPAEAAVRVAAAATPGPLSPAWSSSLNKHSSAGQHLQSLGVGELWEPCCLPRSTLDKGPFCIPNLPEAFIG